MSRVYLGIGANLNPEENIAKGLARLAEDVHILRCSPSYRSAAAGFDGPDFINLVVEVETELAPELLNQTLKKIEFEFGRQRDTVKYSSRHLDIDILLYDQQVAEFDGFSIPRKDVYQFAFVLQPLLDLEPNMLCPKTAAPLSDYLQTLEDQTLEQL